MEVYETIYNFVEKLQLLNPSGIAGHIGPTNDRSSDVISNMAKKRSMNLFSLEVTKSNTSSDSISSWRSVFNLQGLQTALAHLIEVAQ